MKTIEEVIKNIENNNMQGFYAEKKEDVIGIVKTLIKEGDTVAVGGSMSLFETGVIDFLKKENYNFLDRYKENLTSEDIRNIYVNSYSADSYFCSSNAVTEDGELFNVDGNSNRISAICYGPLQIIMVVGINKIVKNIDEAIMRVKTNVAPKNCKRLSCNTYCSKEGKCVSDEGFKGCNTDFRICCNYLISSKQRQKNRIKIIFVGESIGY